MILILIYLTFYILFDAWSDVYVQKKGKISHFLKSCVAGINIGFMSYFAMNLQLDGGQLWRLIFVALTYRWILFDLSYNFFAGNRWDYTGKSQLLQGWFSLACKSLCLFFAVLFTMELFYV